MKSGDVLGGRYRLEQKIGEGAMGADWAADDVGETPDGEPFLVLELLKGKTLGEILKDKRRIEPSLAARIAGEVFIAKVLDVDFCKAHYVMDSVATQTGMAMGKQ